MPLMKHSYDNRDAHGNLPGGEMNHGMQSRVVGDTIEDIEARRLRAQKQAHAHANFPRSLDLNDVQLPLYKYSELEDLGKQTLKKRCLDFRDMIELTGCKFFENHTHLKLNAAQGEDKMLEWYIHVQVTLAEALGMDELDHAAFGAPHLAGNLPPPMTHNKQQRQPQTRYNPISSGMSSQQRQPQQQMSQQQYEQMMMQQQQQMQQQQMQQQQQQMQQQYYQEENYANRPPPSRGMQQKPPPSRGMHDNSDPDASRFDDAARIRARNNEGSNIFG